MMGLSPLANDDRTSAAGAMHATPWVDVPLLIGLMLAGVGTGSTLVRQAMSVPRRLEQTHAGLSLPRQAKASSALGELRRLTGFTWDQLARLFQVSRRSLHFWASGKPMAASHEERLLGTLEVIRRIDRGSATQNRADLLSPNDGQSPFELLSLGQYDRVLTLLGAGNGRARPPPTNLSETAWAARAPLRPEALAGANPDRIHTDVGETRPARSVKVRSGR